MKQLVVDIPYEKLWAGFFGRNRAKVEVLEAIKCFKCDYEGFAIICRISLDGNITLDELTEGGSIKKVELLYKQNDGSMVIFMSGRFPEALKNGKRLQVDNLFQARPPEFVGVDKMRAEIIGDESNLQGFLKTGEVKLGALKILSLTRLEPRRKGESADSTLSPQQRRTLLTAYGLGYYDLPKKVTSDQLARLLKIDKSTLTEHLRKAERKLVSSVIGG